MSGLEAEVARLREYERRWLALERLVHHWRQDGPRLGQPAGAVRLALLLCEDGDVLCTRPGHDCATWQPPVEPGP